MFRLWCSHWLCALFVVVSPVSGGRPHPAYMFGKLGRNYLNTAPSRSEIPSESRVWVPGFYKYPESDADWTVVGHMTVVTTSTLGQQLRWNLLGVDAECSGACSAKNCCGVHIHTGTSCGTADGVGGHFWDESVIPKDPWGAVRYFADPDGSAEGGYSVEPLETGLEVEDIVGRVMIVHDFQGGRIACGVIQEIPSTLWVPEFYGYPGSVENWNVAGQMKVVANPGQGQQLLWTLSGIDVDCTAEVCSAANCCGVHIHAGTSCANADGVGGHFWDDSEIPSDPWGAVRYVAKSDGTADGGNSNQTLFTGLEADEIVGRVMIVHNFQGGRIACGVIQELPSEDPVPEQERALPGDSRGHRSSRAAYWVYLFLGYCVHRLG